MIYTVTGESGPAHDKRFQVTVALNGKALAVGEGRSKKAAEQQAAKAALTGPMPEASEYATGYAADILAADSAAKDETFAQSLAYEWLTAYAAEYGFILRCPEDRQAATGMAFAPWHWRYVGVENALAIRASGLSLD